MKTMQKRHTNSLKRNLKKLFLQKTIMYNSDIYRQYLDNREISLLSFFRKKSENKLV